ncbi:MAG: thiamine-phosphate kinase [Akkermansiaceae bacterium]|nr:thiamine-phosphate kinase [Akkermansiaceae bacterium]
MKSVRQLGEDGLIARICRDLPKPTHVIVGPGDDCAVVGAGEELTLLKTDAVVAGVHFLHDEKSTRVGWKAVARVLSDFAAMGGEPGELLITLALAPEVSVDWVDGLYRGISSCLKQHGGVIVGGETISLPQGAPTMVSVAGKGRVARANLVTRGGGRLGDGIYVTGRLGGSIHGKHLDFTPRLREAAWLVNNGWVTAMMDLSDGLAKDLPRLARMSGVGFELDRDSLPCSEGSSPAEAISDGEDYELLFTSGDDLKPAWGEKFPGLEITRIGTLIEGIGDTIEGGWDHFQR